MKLLEVSLASRLALMPHHSLGAMACAVLAATAFGCAACHAPVKPPPAVTKSTAPAHDPKRDQQAVEYKCLLTGERLVEQAKWQEVATYCAALEARFPKSTYLDRIIFYQGLAHICNADFALSTNLFERVTRNYPKSEFYEAALYYLAMAHFMNNEYQKTVAACSEYLRKYPDGLYAGDLQYRLSYIDSNDPRVEPNKIITEIETFMEGHPNDVSNGSMLCLLADTYKKNHEDDKALAAYQKALWSKSPDDVIQYALDSATTILQAKKDWSAIAEMHGEYLRRNPDNPFSLHVIEDKAKRDIREGKGEECARMLADSLRPRIGNPTIQQVEYLLDLMVQAVVPRKKPAKEEMAALADQLDKQLVETLKQVVGDKSNPPATARMLYAQARLSQLLYRKSRTERSDLLLKDLTTKYAREPAVLSPTLLSVCGDILLQENDLEGAEAMFRYLTANYKDSLFCDAGPLGLGNLALARKNPEQALKIFEDTLTNNHGTSRFCETTLGKIQALIDLGKFDEGRKLAEQVVGDKKFRGEMAAKAYLMMADGYRVEAAKAPPGDGATELLKKAYATYQRVEITYQSLPEICAEAYWQAAETAKELNEDGLAAENLKALIDHPRLQETRRAKDAKDAKILNP